MKQGDTQRYYGRCRACAKTVEIIDGTMSVTKPYVSDEKRKRPFVPRPFYKGRCPECGGNVSVVVYGGDAKGAPRQSKIGDYWKVGDVAQALKTHREACGLSQDAIAKRLRVSQTAYANYENGRRCPNAEHIKQLADVFGTTTDSIGFRDITEGKKSLGRRLQEQRRRCEMSRTQVAERIGTSECVVGLYENGKRFPTLERLLALAGLFNVRPEDLLPGAVFDE